MSASKSPRRTARKNDKTLSVLTSDQKNERDYSNLDALAADPLGAVRRGLWARHLAKAREHAGYKPAALASELGVSRTTVSQWETGQTALSWLDARRIAEVLNIDPHLLYDDPELRKGAGRASPSDAAFPYSGPDAPLLPADSRWWRVSGHTLALRGLHDGDLVAITEKRHTYNGCIALLALGQTDGSTCYLLRECAGGYFVGCGPGPLPEPIPYAPEHAHILGIATALYRPLVQGGKEESQVLVRGQNVGES